MLAAQALQALFLVEVTGASMVGPQEIVPGCNFKMLLTLTSDTLKRLAGVFHNSRVPGKHFLCQANGDACSKRGRYSVV